MLDMDLWSSQYASSDSLIRRPLMQTIVNNLNVGCRFVLMASNYCCALQVMSQYRAAYPQLAGLAHVIISTPSDGASITAL